MLIANFCAGVYSSHTTWKGWWSRLGRGIWETELKKKNLLVKLDKEIADSKFVNGF